MSSSAASAAAAPISDKKDVKTDTTKKRKDVDPDQRSIDTFMDLKTRLDELEFAKIGDLLTKDISDDDDNDGDYSDDDYGDKPVAGDKKEPDWKIKLRALVKPVIERDRSDYSCAVELHSPNCTVVLLNGKPIETMDHSALLTLSTPSPFGDLKSGATKLDDTVRMAREIVPSNGAVITLTPIGQRFINRFCRLASNALFMRDPIELTVSKINIYPVGGHFAKHQDTPRPGVLGSAVLELQSDRKGGDLVFHRGGKTHVVGRGCISAFYADVIHEVTPVTEGTRVTISFHIIKKKDIVEQTPCSYPKCKDARRFGDCFVHCKFLEDHNEIEYKELHQLVGEYGYWEKINDARTRLGRKVRDRFRLEVGDAKFKSDGYHYTDAQMDAEYWDAGKVVKFEDTTAGLSSPFFTSKLDDVMSTIVSVANDNHPIGFIWGNRYSLDELSSDVKKSSDGELVRRLRELSQQTSTNNLVFKTVNVLINKVKLKPVEANPSLKIGVLLFDLKSKKTPAGFPSNITFIHMGHGGDHVFNEEEKEAERTGNESRDGFERNIYFHVATVIYRHNEESPSSSKNKKKQKTTSSKK